MITHTQVSRQWLRSGLPETSSSRDASGIRRGSSLCPDPGKPASDRSRMGIPVPFARRKELQVAAVLHLKRRVFVSKPAPFPLLAVQSETQAGRINPTLADLLQKPCRVTGTQGVRHFLQTRGVAAMNKTIIFFDEFHRLDGILPGLVGDIFVTVENDLRREGRMAAHPDRDMSPVVLPDMKK